jgi:hypothetical protein
MLVLPATRLVSCYGVKKDATISFETFEKTIDFGVKSYSTENTQPPVLFAWMM